MCVCVCVCVCLCLYIFSLATFLPHRPLNMLFPDTVPTLSFPTLRELYTVPSMLLEWVTLNFLSIFALLIALDFLIKLYMRVAGNRRRERRRRAEENGTQRSSRRVDTMDASSSTTESTNPRKKEEENATQEASELDMKHTSRRSRSRSPKSRSLRRKAKISNPLNDYEKHEEPKTIKV